MNRNLFIILFVILILGNSCLHRQFVEGRYLIKSTADTAIHDSSLIFGHVRYLDWPDKKFYSTAEFEIRIDNPGLKTTTDTTGYYSLNTIPGTYTITCQSSFNDWDKLAEKVEVELQKNEKMEIDFYIGTTIE